MPLHGCSALCWNVELGPSPYDDRGPYGSSRSSSKGWAEWDGAARSGASQTEVEREWNSTETIREGRSDEDGSRGGKVEAEDTRRRKISGIGERSNWSAGAKGKR